MPYIDFSQRKNVKIWDGIHARMFHSEQITFAHVSLDQGAIVGEHAHVHEQWTHVIEGEMEFDIGGEIKILTKGMAAFIPGNVIHSARAITQVKVIDCFLPVREDFIELERNSQ